MTKDEYLEELFRLLTLGEISEEAYDSVLMSLEANNFPTDEE